MDAKVLRLSVMGKERMINENNTRVEIMKEYVLIVRCRDCKYKDAETGFCEGRGWPMQLVPDDGFCDKGKRRTDA